MSNSSVSSSVPFLDKSGTSTRSRMGGIPAITSCSFECLLYIEQFFPFWSLQLSQLFLDGAAYRKIGYTPLAPRALVDIACWPSSQPCDCSCQWSWPPCFPSLASTARSSASTAGNKQYIQSLTWRSQKDLNNPSRRSGAINTQRKLTTRLANVWMRRQVILGIFILQPLILYWVLFWGNRNSPGLYIYCVWQAAVFESLITKNKSFLLS